MVIAVAFVPAQAQLEQPAVDLRTVLERAAEAAACVPDCQSRAVALAEVAALYAQVHDSRARTLFADAKYACSLADDPFIAIVAERGVMARWALLDRDKALERFERLLDAARGLRYAAQRSLACRELGRSLIPLDPEMARQAFAAAREYASVLESPLFAAASLRDLAVSIAPLDQPLADEIMQQASDLLDAMPLAEAGQNLACAELAAAWAIWDLPAALAEADKLLGAERDYALLAIVRALTPLDCSQALQLANEVTADAQRAVAIALCAAQLPPQQAGVAAALARQALILGADLQGQEYFELQTLCAAALASDVDAALAVVAQLHDPDAHAEALGAVAVKIACCQPDRALQILSDIEILPARDAATYRVVQELAAADIVRAYQLVDDLRSQRRRAFALIELAKILLAPNDTNQ